MRFYSIIFGLLLSTLFFVNADARMPEPADVPVSLKGGEPHKPQVVRYYLQELVKEGKMTQYEAERTEIYMIFRNARRMQDLKEAEKLGKEERRALMKHKRELRGNPLKEYADYCGFSYDRARTLMDAMHGSDKGEKYYNQLQKKKVNS